MIESPLPRPPSNLMRLSDQRAAAYSNTSSSTSSQAAGLVGQHRSAVSLSSGSSSAKHTTPKAKRAVTVLPLDPPPAATANSEKAMSAASKSAVPHPERSSSLSSSPPKKGGESSHKSVHPPEPSKGSLPHNKTDDRPHHFSSSTTASRRSKRSSSRHRRLLTELFHLYYPQSDRAEPPGHSTVAVDPSPADSHHSGGGHRTHSHHHAFRPSSHPPSSTTSISDVLIMTTERLHIETARANAAERQTADVMSLFKNAHDQKGQLEGELSRIRGELGWYKIQLDVAQKEIFRAQEIVERVDRQRVEAEEAAVRAREKSRKLSEARAVDLALEEGRRLGFEEGLKHGRTMAAAAAAQISDEAERAARSKSRTTSSSGSSSNNHKKSKPSSHGEASKSSSRPPRRSRTPANDSKAGITTVDEKRGRRLSRPEEIAIQGSNAPRSKSKYGQSPDAFSRRSVVLPPDNYIPVLNEDATISLPAPHELALPVPPEGGPLRTDARTPSNNNNNNRPRSNTGSTLPIRPPAEQNLGADIRAPVPRRAVSPIPKVASESTEPRSPATYPNRPPRRTREIVMPVPLGNAFPSGIVSTMTAGGSGYFSRGPRESSPNQHPTTTPPHTAIRVPSSTIPDINVQTPSSRSARSDRTPVLDHGLLSPEHAHVPLASSSSSSHREGEGEVVRSQSQSQSLGLYNADSPGANRTPALPPPASGFVELSPIPGMANLNPYPVGLHLNESEKEPPGFIKLDTDYVDVYPSSPLAR